MREQTMEKGGGGKYPSARTHIKERKDWGWGRKREVRDNGGAGRGGVVVAHAEAREKKHGHQTLQGVWVRGGNGDRGRNTGVLSPLGGSVQMGGTVGRGGGGESRVIVCSMLQRTPVASRRPAFVYYFVQHFVAACVGVVRLLFFVVVAFFAGHFCVCFFFCFFLLLFFFVEVNLQMVRVALLHIQPHPPAAKTTPN